MNVLAINELAQLKASITALSRTGKYGEAVRKINHLDLKAKTYLSSDDLDGFICGWLCCDTVTQNWCLCGSCCGFMAIVNCCGGEVAGVCCGCDWLIDECCY